MTSDKKHLLTYLKSERLLSLATCSDKLEISTFYYAANDAFILYFITEPQKQCAQNIQNNPQVVCVIFDSRQKVIDKKVGVQIQGNAFQITDEKEMRKAIKLWTQANPGIDVINFKSIKDNKIQGRFFKIIPTRVRFFNEELYGPEGIKVITF